MAAPIPKVSLKLLVDTKEQRVIFAEAGKDFIDFLFHLLSLPLATVIRIVTKQQMMGSLSNLYESIENFNHTYIQPNQEKDTLLKPKNPVPNLSTKVPLLPFDSTPEVVAPAPSIYRHQNKSFYMCNNSYSYSGCASHVGDDSSICCPRCNGKLTKSVTLLESPIKAAAEKAAAEKAAAVSSGEGGFVKELVSYMVMDDLVVMPLSITSSITQLSKLNVKEVGVLEERIVEVGMNEGVKLLKESLQSKTVLTNVFLEKKTAKVEPVDVGVIPSYEGSIVKVLLDKPMHGYDFLVLIIVFVF